MNEKKMTLGELIGWLDSNGVPYEIDDTGRLTVKGDLCRDFRPWVEAHRYTSLPDELFHVDGDLWLEQTSIMSLGGLTSVKGGLDLRDTSITSLDNLTSVGGSLYLWSTPITSLDDLPQVGEHLYLDQSQFQFLTGGALQKVKGKIKHRDQATEELTTLSPDELEAIAAENEQREKLSNTRESDVDWDLYDR